MATNVGKPTQGRGEQLSVFLLVCFLLVFPKGGFKVAEVPITWGYLLLLLLGAYLVFTNLASGVSATRRRWLILIAAAPFQAFVLFVLLFYGFLSTGFALSIVVSVIIIPWIFVILLSRYFETASLDPLMELVRKGLFIVAVYGIGLFVYKIVTGNWIEIPFLTINYGDTGLLDYKHINRGGSIFKLISTYNNGNIYGISILMLLPFYEQIEKRGWKTVVVKASLILTLSRTVWIGLVFYELVMQFYIRRQFSKTILRQFGLLTVGVGGVLAALYLLLGRSIGFVFDANLGGRAVSLGALSDFSFLPDGPYHVISEMVYLSVLQNFGLLGLLLFLAMMLATITLNLDVSSSKRRALMAGLILYLLVAISDGAIMFIPVMAFYWFVVSMLSSRNSSLD